MPSVLPPGPRDRFRTTARWALRPAGLLDECHARYGHAFTLDLVKFGPACFFASPEAAEALFRADPLEYRAGKTKFVRPVLGPSSLLCLDGKEHLRQRRLLVPALHGERLADHAQTTREVVEAEAARWPVGVAFRLAEAMERISLEVVLRTVFGVRDGPRRRELAGPLRALIAQAAGSRAQLVRMAARRDLTAPPPRGSVLARRLDAADHALHAVVAERRREPAGGDDVLSLLLAARGEDGAPMDDAEVRDALMTLLLAGHETTATTLAWAFERLLRHPDAWERLRADAADGGTGAWAAAVATETLRTRPVLWLAGRTLLTERTVAGHKLPAGTLAYVCSYLLHRREDLYPDALAFRPERFLGAGRGAYRWVPFGGGPRRCIGAAFAEQELRTVLTAVAASTRLRAVDPARPERFRRRGIVVAPDRGALAVRQL